MGNLSGVCIHLPPIHSASTFIALVLAVTLHTGLAGCVPPARAVALQKNGYCYNGSWW